MTAVFRTYDDYEGQTKIIDIKEAALLTQQKYNYFGGTIFQTLRTTIQNAACPRCAKDLLTSLDKNDFTLFEKFHNKGLTEIEELLINEYGVQFYLVKNKSTLMPYIHALAAYKPLTVTEIELLLEDLSYLPNLCFTVHINSYYENESLGCPIKISCDTPEIIIEDLNFGAFTMSLEWSPNFYLSIGKEIHCTPLTPNLSYHRTGTKTGPYFHPHVDYSGNMLCLGEAVAPILRAYHSFNLSSLFDIVQSTLSTYNPDSPYQILDSWRGVKCTSCDKVYTDKDWSGRTKKFVACAHCLIYYCPDCMSECPHCRKRFASSAHFCGKCSFKCPICEKRFCLNGIAGWTYNTYGDREKPTMCYDCLAIKEAEEEAKRIEERAKKAAIAKEKQDLQAKAKTEEEAILDKRKAAIQQDVAQLQTLKEANAQIFGSWDPISEGDF